MECIEFRTIFISVHNFCGAQCVNGFVKNVDTVMIPFQTFNDMINQWKSEYRKETQNPETNAHWPTYESNKNITAIH